MDISPIKMLQLKKKWEAFTKAHPRFIAFMNAAPKAATAGSIIAVTMTMPDGRTMSTNLKLTDEDIEALREASEVFETLGR